MSTAVLASLHGVQRARGRYGLDLGWPALKSLMQRCADGEGAMETQPDGTRWHTLVVGDQVIWLIYSPATGKIVTALPAGAVNARVRRDFNFMRRRQQRGRS